MKTQVQSYAFDKTAKTITFSGYASIRLDAVLVIENVTRGVMLYNFADASMLATVATNVLTLNAGLDTSAMANTDKLTIIYWDSALDGAGTEAGALRVTLPTDGTGIVNAKQSGAWAGVGVTGTFWQATQPVSGTFWQATQPVSGTFWQTTQPVSAASLPLPTGAATQTTLAAINTTLGTPFQAGGSIGNTTFSVTNSGTFATQSVCTNGGTFAVQAAQAGTWTVGLSAAQTLATVTTVGTVTLVSTVTTVSTVTAVTAITNALPAGTNLLGKVSVGHDTSTVYNGTTALTPKFASISASTNGDNTLVAAVTSKKIRVLSVLLMSSGTVSARFQTAAAGAYLSGALPLVANGGFSLPYNPAGWFETVAGDLLNLELSAGTGVGGTLSYVEV